MTEEELCQYRLIDESPMVRIVAEVDASWQEIKELKAELDELKYDLESRIGRNVKAILQEAIDKYEKEGPKL